MTSTGRTTSSTPRRSVAAVALAGLLLAASPSGPAASAPGPAASAPGAAVSAPGPAVSARPVGSPSRRVPPVSGGVVRPFRAPLHEYGPGHRGVDLAAGPADVVRAPAPGTVTFAGQVAGRGVVVVEHADGTLTSLEPVTATAARGTRVAGGAPVAVLSAVPRHAGCATACLHWGVRVGGRYVDPWWWLGLTRPVRLLPVTGAW